MNYQFCAAKLQQKNDIRKSWAKKRASLKRDSFLNGVPDVTRRVALGERYALPKKLECVGWVAAVESGFYIIDFFCDGNLIGSFPFQLKK